MDKKIVKCYWMDAIEECIKAAENDSGWTGWRIPLYADYDEDANEIVFSIGGPLSNGSYQPDEFEAYSCEYWSRYWNEDDAERWANECKCDAEDFNCEDEFQFEVDAMVKNFEDWKLDDFENELREHFSEFEIDFER